MTTTLNIEDLKGVQTINIWKDEQYFIALDDTNSTNEDLCITINIDWDDSTLHIKWRIIAENSAIKKYQLMIHLRWKNQKLILDIKAIADDKSLISIWWGGFVHETSENAEVKVNEKLLLFSKDAHWDIFPWLSVDTENIWPVSHSWSISPINGKELFYFESRGISEKKAKQILKKSILDER